MEINWNDSDFAFLKNQLETGRVVLFLGAGFSAEASNSQGVPPPLGLQLAKILAERAGYPYSGEPLHTVFHAVEHTIGGNEIRRMLKELYRVSSFAEWYSILRASIWYRIYSTNIDNLIQKIWAQDGEQNLDTIACPAVHHDILHFCARVLAIIIRNPRRCKLNVIGLTAF